MQKRERSNNDFFPKKKKFKLSEDFDDLKFPSISNAKHNTNIGIYTEDQNDSRENLRAKSINDKIFNKVDNKFG